MPSTEKIPFEQLPQTVLELKQEISGLKTLITGLIHNTAEDNTDQWMNIDQLRSYHPDRPARSTIYDWVYQNRIPVHKDGKKTPLPQKRNRPMALRRKNQNPRRARNRSIQPPQKQKEMSQPVHICESLLKIAADLNDPMGRTLRQCPFIQAKLIRRKIISLDDLTDEQIDRLIEWDQQNNPHK